MDLISPNMYDVLLHAASNSAGSKKLTKTTRREERIGEYHKNSVYELQGA
jgi:hypothetical protein